MNLHNGTAQSAISDFGLEMQDSSDLEIPGQELVNVALARAQACDRFSGSRYSNECSILPRKMVVFAVIFAIE